MDLRRLRYFVTVAEELHFGRAADRLHMAQPPLSQQIRRLEADIGFDLFDRTTRRVALTQEGIALLPEARDLLARDQSLERHIDHIARGDSGLLRLGFVDSSSYDVLPRFLRSYRSLYPKVTYELVTMSSDAQVAALHEGTIDGGIARTRANDTALTATLILRESLFVALGADHPLAEAAEISLTELGSEPLIGFNRETSP